MHCVHRSKTYMLLSQRFSPDSSVTFSPELVAARAQCALAFFLTLLGLVVSHNSKLSELSQHIFWILRKSRKPIEFLTSVFLLEVNCTESATSAEYFVRRQFCMCDDMKYEYELRTIWPRYAKAKAKR